MTLHPVKTARAIKYIVEKLGNVGTTQLVKLVYLSDLNARGLLGKPISGLDYHYKQHGPFDKTFYTAVEVLERQGCVVRRRRPFGLGKEKVHIIDCGAKSDFFGAQQLSEGERYVLDYVIREYGRMGLPALLDYVYSTKPMKLAEKEERLPMEVVNGETKGEIGFDLEEVLEAKRRADQGHVRKASEFFDSLRSANRG